MSGCAFSRAVWRLSLRVLTPSEGSREAARAQLRRRRRALLPLARARRQHLVLPRDDELESRAARYRLSPPAMCDVIDERGLEPLEDDEWVLDTPLVRDFVDGARAAIERSASAAETCRLLEPRFQELLAGPDWLPRRFQEDAPESGMGGG